MRPTLPAQLLRPWKKYKDGTLFYGFSKTGNKRWGLSTKQGNRNHYKGTGSTGVGKWTSKGQYRLNWEKVRTFVVPQSLETTDLRPLVCPTTPNIRNGFVGYKRGALDGQLHLRKTMEFVKFGMDESPEMAREDGWKERG